MVQTFEFISPVSKDKVDRAILSIDAALEKMRAEKKTESDTYKTYQNIQLALLGWAQLNYVIESMSRQVQYLKQENEFVKQQNATLAAELNIYTTLQILESNDGLNAYLVQLREKMKKVQEMKEIKLK